MMSSMAPSPSTNRPRRIKRRSTPSWRYCRIPPVRLIGTFRMIFDAPRVLPSPRRLPPPGGGTVAALQPAPDPPAACSDRRHQREDQQEERQGLGRRKRGFPWAQLQDIHPEDKMADKIDESQNGGNADQQEQPPADAAPDAVSLVHAASLAVFLLTNRSNGTEGKYVRAYSGARALPMTVRASGFSSDERSP